MTEAAEVIDLTKRLPTNEEIANAARAATLLAAELSKNGGLEIGQADETPIRLGSSLSQLIIELLSHVAKGNMVTLVPTGAMLTTQQAADILNVSRPYFSNLLKEREIDFVQVGTHRRVKFDVLMEYKNMRDENRLDALKELAALGQELDKS